VHDDVVLEVDAAALPRVAALVRAVMEGAGAAAGVTVPLAVRLRAGPDWHNLADLD
jgi:DNA polymerase I-like protein with 3'-5' exonuclease and polymerase domains